MGIPFNVIMGGTAARMYKSLGYSDGQITVALGSIGVAWSLKPFWAAFLDMYRTKKFFVLTMELLLAVIFSAVALSLPVPGFFQISIALFWVAAFASSTQDICADGIYLTALDKPAQAKLAGVQSTFWVLGKVLAAGVLISTLDGIKVANHWPEQKLWTAVMLVCGASMVLLAVYHVFQLPPGSISHRPESAKQVVGDFLDTAATFFQKRAFWGMIAFVFLYRLGEGLILLEGQLFLQSSVAMGGLGLSAGQVSDIDAEYGMAATILGGLIGGWVAGRFRLSRTLWILGLCLNVPHFTYVFLSHVGAAGHGAPYSTIVTMVTLEKFGYGFGMVGNMIYMMQQLAPGRSTMTHYAFATALMNLVLVPTNMISGPLAEALGFSTFFFVVMFASIPSVWAAWRAPFPLDDDQRSDVPNDPGTLAVVTLDDPTRLAPLQRAIQLIAGRASIYAMLQILTILLLDAKILGSLQGQAPGAGRTQFYLLLGTAALKLFLAQRTLQQSRLATAEAAQGGETIYVRNAVGARVVTGICAVISIAILVFAGKVAF
jgi:MFS transporter, PAT family, beta-lactamase induction signal transducer AmpG